MSSIFSTQKRQTFLRRKYCLRVAIALSPPVGRCEALMGRPPFCCSAIVELSSTSHPCADRRRQEPGPPGRERRGPVLQAWDHGPRAPPGRACPEREHLARWEPQERPPEPVCGLRASHALCAAS